MFVQGPHFQVFENRQMNIARFPLMITMQKGAQWILLMLTGNALVGHRLHFILHL